ncbi:bifunctional RNA 3'-terminal phosphate cyclase type 2/RNA 3'-terminal phosphate cyclase/RNA 3'-terminal phosphate cyclase-enolpyruvate transferase [Babesia duncani]|nr:bifunctional RNA 3'-terminal phosphate cyclase type 2/RNA 3'-terminal phosphate cyclase/RNA 3'-terminal phosphate cyclase-enolpyruvate transferase [Babesia duncani]
MLTLIPGKINGGTFSFTCSATMPLTYYLEPLIYLAPLAPENVHVTLQTSGKLENLDLYPSLECLCSVATLLLRHLNCNNVQFRYKEPFEVIFECSPLNRIAPFDLSVEARVKKIRGTAQVRNLQPSIGKSLVIGAKRILDCVCDNVWIALASPPGKQEPMISCSLIAEGTSNCMYTASITQWLQPSMYRDPHVLAIKGLANSSLSKILDIAQRESNNIKENLEQPSLFQEAERLGSDLAKRLLDEVSLGGTYDTSLQHLPLVFMALAGDYRVCKLRLGRLNSFTIATLRLIKTHLGVACKFESVNEGGYIIHCVGTNYINAGVGTF